MMLPSEVSVASGSDRRINIMRAAALTLVSLIALTVTANARTRIDAINTNFRWLGPDDKMVVERYDDPKVANVSCYMSRAETGGIKGGLGFAEDPSRFSVACRATGPMAVPPGLRKSEVIAFASGLWCNLTNSFAESDSHS